MGVETDVLCAEETEGGRTAPVTIIVDGAEDMTTSLCVCSYIRDRSGCCCADRRLLVQSSSRLSKLKLIQMCMHQTHTAR